VEEAGSLVFSRGSSPAKSLSPSKVNNRVGIADSLDKSPFNINRSLESSPKTKKKRDFTETEEKLKVVKFSKGMK
jgi:hypothetical protein